jgi:hypothetical protein
VNDELEKMCPNFKVLSQHLPVGIERNHKKTSARIASLQAEI